MIEVEYTCDSCGIKSAKVPIRERGKDEDVRDWMKIVTAALGADHYRKSPRCRVTSLTNAKIPIDPSGGRIGDPTSH